MSEFHSAPLSLQTLHPGIHRRIGIQPPFLGLNSPLGQTQIQLHAQLGVFRYRPLANFSQFALFDTADGIENSQLSEGTGEGSTLINPERDSGEIATDLAVEETSDVLLTQLGDTDELMPLRFDPLQPPKSTILGDFEQKSSSKFKEMFQPQSLSKLGDLGGETEAIQTQGNLDVPDSVTQEGDEERNFFANQGEIGSHHVNSVQLQPLLPTKIQHVEEVLPDDPVAPSKSRTTTRSKQKTTQKAKTKKTSKTTSKKPVRPTISKSTQAAALIQTAILINPDTAQIDQQSEPTLLEVESSPHVDRASSNLSTPPLQTGQTEIPFAQTANEIAPPPKLLETTHYIQASDDISSNEESDQTIELSLANLTAQEVSSVDRTLSSPNESLVSIEQPETSFDTSINKVIQSPNPLETATHTQEFEGTRPNKNLDQSAAPTLIEGSLIVDCAPSDPSKASESTKQSDVPSPSINEALQFSNRSESHTQSSEDSLPDEKLNQSIASTSVDSIDPIVDRAASHLSKPTTEHSEVPLVQLASATDEATPQPSHRSEIINPIQASDIITPSENLNQNLAPTLPEPFTSIQAENDAVNAVPLVDPITHPEVDFRDNEEKLIESNPSSSFLHRAFEKSDNLSSDEHSSGELEQPTLHAQPISETVRSSHSASSTSTEEPSVSDGLRTTSLTELKHASDNQHSQVTDSSDGIEPSNPLQPVKALDQEPETEASAPLIQVSQFFFDEADPKTQNTFNSALQNQEISSQDNVNSTDTEFSELSRLPDVENFNTQNSDLKSATLGEFREQKPLKPKQEDLSSLSQDEIKTSDIVLSNPDPSELHRANHIETEVSTSIDQTIPDDLPNDRATLGFFTGGEVKASAHPNEHPIAPSDTVSAMLTPGEFVINASATQEHLELLQHINAGGTIQQPEITAEPPRNLIHRKISDTLLPQSARTISSYSGTVDLSSSQSGYAQPSFVFRKTHPVSEMTAPDEWSSIEDLLFQSDSSNSVATTHSTNFSQAQFDQRIVSNHSNASSLQGFAKGGIVPEPRSTNIQSVGETIQAFPDDEDMNSNQLEALAQEIYQRLQQRLELERERYGYHAGRLPW